MGDIFDTAASFFKEDDWPFRQLEEQPILQMGFQGENGRWTCFAQAREEQKQFIFYSVCSANAPQDRRVAVAEFLSRADYGLIIGNFELDRSHGEVRYKTSIDVEGDRLSPVLLKQLVHANVMTMDRYLPGIMKVMYGAASPAEAVAKIEG